MGEGLDEQTLLGRNEVIAQFGMKDPGGFDRKSEYPKISYKDFLDLICCPVCHGDIGEVEGALECKGKCKGVYNIENGIPLMSVRFSGVGDLPDADL